MAAERGFPGEDWAIRELVGRFEAHTLDVIADVVARCREA